MALGRALAMRPCATNRSTRSLSNPSQAIRIAHGMNLCTTGSSGWEINRFRFSVITVSRRVYRWNSRPVSTAWVTPSMICNVHPNLFTFLISDIASAVAPSAMRPRYLNSLTFALSTVRIQI